MTHQDPSSTNTASSRLSAPFLTADGPFPGDDSRLRLRDPVRRPLPPVGRRKSPLEREILRRQAAEAELREGKDAYRILFLESQVMQKKLRQLARRVISAQEDERRLISRELHDDVVQTLVGISVKLSALGQGASTDLRALRGRIAHTRRLVENSVRLVHQFARELRPAVLDDLGLIPALHAYSRTLARRERLRIRLTAFGGVETLGCNQRTALFRIAQEALTNVARHARATEVTMTIVRIGDTVRMEIGDNGRSFDVARVSLARNPKRLGLIGMKERIEMIGGRFTIESQAGTGTTVRAELPFPGPKGEA